MSRRVRNRDGYTGKKKNKGGVCPETEKITKIDGPLISS
jgi:hypothetical protein